LKYIKLFESFDLLNEKYNRMALNYANTYYSDEIGDAPYGDYDEILDRLNDFCTTDFPYGLKNIPTKVVLYRLLNVDDINNINKNELGKSYVGDKKMFEDEDFLESFLFRYGEDMKKWFIVTIETTRNNIDFEHSMGNRAEYPAEFEITIKNDKDLKILNIEEFKNTDYI
jgi:hypothetical protein